VGVVDGVGNVAGCWLGLLCGRGWKSCFGGWFDFVGGVRALLGWGYLQFYRCGRLVKNLFG
jgi:hypothetical protein